MKFRYLFAGLLLSAGIFGQDLPQPSPAAHVTQRVGLTDVEITYSRPALKGREVFGSLVPYDEVWRTGANKCSSVSFSTNVSFGDVEVPAGTYSLFTIPGKDAWTVILNKNTELWGSDGYDKNEDVARVKVEPKQSAENVESLRLSVENVSADAAELELRWANVVVSVPVKVNTSETALKNIEKAIAENGNDWRVLRNSANYYYQNKMHLDKAEEYINKAVSLNGESWYSFYLQAEILLANGKKKEAIKAAEKSLKVGQDEAKANGREFGYTEMINGIIKKAKA